jgi:A/G-specific adenine glycosylase
MDAALGRLSAETGEALLAWYDRHRRSLPWRVPAGTADPYRVWLSEVMLQQTTVAAVAPYFRRFTERWPTVEALASAPDEEVMSAWAGLGYYARARNLLACARAVTAAGGFPPTRESLRALPGVGEYTSAAVAAIAWGERVAAVDGNVERVVARLVALPVPPKTARRTVTAAVEAMMPAERPGDFAQAMMDLGATICTPKRPVCALCPIRPWCAAAGQDPLAFPVKAARRARRVWEGVAFVPWRADGATLLRRRPDRGLLGGMPEVWGSPWGPAPERPEDHAPFAAGWEEAGAVSHGFTHADLTLRVFRARVADAPAPAGGQWRDPAGAGLPTLMRKVVERAAG